MLKREISKTPDMPFITSKLQSSLTTLCFGEQKTFKQVDVVFVYGTPFFIEQAAAMVSALIENNQTQKVVLTGGTVPYGQCIDKDKSEAALVYQYIAYLKDRVDIYVEEHSKNTLANVTESLKIVDFSCSPSIAFIFPSHGARRGYLTLRKHCPDAEIYQHSYNAHYPNEIEPVSRENWHETEQGQRRVWGEYLRIKEYGQRGDIAFDEVAEMVAEISTM